MSLHARVAGLIALTVALALLAQGLFGYLDFRQSALRDVNADLSSYLAAMVHDRATGTYPKPTENEAGIRARLVQGNRTLQEYGGTFPALADPDGDTHWIIQRASVPDLGVGAVLEASLPLHAYNLGLNAYLHTVLLSVTVMSLLGAAVALLLSRSALRPLDAVLEIAERVTASGDLSARVPEPRGGGELARLGHTFNTMLTRLQAFRQRETEFTRHASHELRTPLTALRAQLDANKHGWVTDAEVLQTADEQVERLTRLTGALLLLSRDNRAVMTAFDLTSQVRDVALHHGAIYCGPDALIWSGNETLMTQALENLLRNAQLHAPGAQVAVALSVQDARILISVEDDGEGVPEDALRHLGEPFYRPAGTRAAGSGLGLAVVGRIAEVHGGEVSVVRAVPQGLRVTLSLPAAQALAQGVQP